MSWWVHLVDADGETVESREPHSEGGSYVLGGTTECDLNVTYNYSGHLAKYNVHPKNDLHGRKGSETRTALETARRRLIADGIDEDHGVTEGSELGCGDYWHDCPANVARCVSTLMSWAHQHPDATWDVN